MTYQPLVLFAEKNMDKADTMCALWRLLIVLNITKKFEMVEVGESVFGGWDVRLTRTANEDNLS